MWCKEKQKFSLHKTVSRCHVYAFYWKVNHLVKQERQKRISILLFIRVVLIWRIIIKPIPDPKSVERVLKFITLHSTHFV